MVLDTFDPESDMLIFKNTYDQEGQEKKVKVSRTDPNAPEELFFVHIEIKDMDNLTDRNYWFSTDDSYSDDLSSDYWGHSTL